jgi:hypothetical protein
MTKAVPACPFEVTRFAVAARPHAGLPGRVLDQFAKRDLLPLRFHAAVVADELRIEVECAGLDDVVASHIRDVFETMVGVTRAERLDTRAARAA